MIALLAALLLALGDEQWEYRPGIGFVEAGSMKRKSPDELLRHAIALREASRYEEAVRILTLLREHAPAVRETALFERAQSFFKAGDTYHAYHDFQAFVKLFPQSERATEAKLLEMTSALELARKGHGEGLFGVTIVTSSRTGIDYLKESLRRYPREDFSSDFAQRLGKFYYEQGDFDLAAAEFTLVLQQYGDTADAVLALWMLGVCAESRFDGTDYDPKPLKEARRHYERFLEEADRLRKLPGAAEKWVNQLVPTIQKRLARIYERLQDKQLKTAEYYDWKGYPRSAALYFRSILKDETAFRRVLPDMKETPAATRARRWLDENAK